MYLTTLQYFIDVAKHVKAGFFSSLAPSDDEDSNSRSQTARTMASKEESSDCHVVKKPDGVQSINGHKNGVSDEKPKGNSCFFSPVKHIMPAYLSDRTTRP